MDGGNGAGAAAAAVPVGRRAQRRVRRAARAAEAVAIAGAGAGAAVDRREILTNHTDVWDRERGNPNWGSKTAEATPQTHLDPVLLKLVKDGKLDGRELDTYSFTRENMTNNHVVNTYNEDIVKKFNQTADLRREYILKAAAKKLTLVVADRITKQLQGIKKAIGTLQAAIRRHNEEPICLPKIFEFPLDFSKFLSPHWTSLSFRGFVTEMSSPFLPRPILFFLVLVLSFSSSSFYFPSSLSFSSAFLLFLHTLPSSSSSSFSSSLSSNTLLFVYCYLCPHLFFFLVLTLFFFVVLKHPSFVY